MELKLFKRVLLLLAVFSFASALPSCKKKNLDNSNPDKIVVVGMENNKAVFWISGESSFKSLTEKPSSALSVAVNGKDIYIAGSIDNKAVLWKNGIAQPLSDKEHSVANSVFIAGEDIYVAGVEDNKAILWRNKSAKYLSASESVAYDVVVEGKDVYVAGLNDEKATCFKNDEKIELGDEKAAAKSIVVKNGVYYCVGETLGKEVALWKKSGDKVEKTTIYKTEMVYPSGNAVAVLGNDIYVGGMKGGGETGMWKNNTEMAIEGVEKNDGAINSLAIYGNNLYIAGYSGDKGFVGKNNKKIHELDFCPFGIAFVNK